MNETKYMIRQMFLFWGWKQAAFHQAANCMRRNNMDLLNEGGVDCWRREAVVAERLHDAVRGVSGEADRRKPALARGLQSRNHIRRPARRRNRDEYIARSSQSAHMPFKGAIKSIIVADRGEDRTVGRERDGWQRIAVKIQPRQQFTGNVLSVGGAAAIAGDQQFVAGTKCCGN